MTERVRGFPAFPAVKGSRKLFAQSWWGKAWVRALEDTSLDGRQLPKGRAYARRGHVGSIAVSPGRLDATVHDIDLREYRVVVRVPELTDPEWGRFWDAVATRASYLLALLDGDMPAELAEAANVAEVPLLPSIGDVDPSCECDAWELPCVHAAALCYQASWLLDADPKVLLLLRGRDEEQLLAEVRDRQAAVAAPAGEPAADAYAHEPGPLPDARAVPAYRPVEVAPGPGVDPESIRRLAHRASLRARALLEG